MTVNWESIYPILKITILKLEGYAPPRRGHKKKFLCASVHAQDTFPAAGKGRTCVWVTAKFKAIYQLRFDL